jgi:hypothetical protein
MENELGISMGFLGIGIDYNTDNTNYPNGYVYGRFLNFTYQTYFGMGLTLSPLLLYYNLTDNDKSLYTFVNSSLFYNFLHTVNNKFILGPFVSINAVDLNNSKFIEFRSGITFSLRDKDEINNDSLLKNEWLFIEAGYKYNETTGHGIFAHIGFNLIVAMLIAGNLFSSGLQ